MNIHEHAHCKQTSHPAACRSTRWLRATSQAALSDWHLRSSSSGRLPSESAEPLVAREACDAVCCNCSQSAAHHWKKLQDTLGLEAMGDVLKLAAWAMHT